MMNTKIRAKAQNGLLVFTHVAVKKESEHFFGVYRYSVWDKRTYGDVITSADTRNRACKKAKLIEIGYQLCQDDLPEY